MSQATAVLTGVEQDALTKMPNGIVNDTGLNDTGSNETVEVEIRPCPVESAAKIIGQKWTLQIVNSLLSGTCKRFCELQDDLGGVNPSTLSSRLKMLEDMGVVNRCQVSDIPPHVEYSLTEMGNQLTPVIQEIARWGNRWLCTD